MAYLTILIIISQLFFSNCSATSKLIEKAVSISSTYYNHHFATTVVWRQNESRYVNEFLKNFPGSVVVYPLVDNDDKIRNINEVIGFRQTIFFAATLHDYEKFVKLLNEIIRFHILFILVLEIPVEEPSELTTFIEVTWNNDQADLVIISGNYANEITLSTFFPYTNGICGNYTPVILMDSDDIFPNKFSNFHQCPVRTALLQFMPYVHIETVNGTITSVSGYDGVILMTILEKLNATLQVTSADNHSAFGTYVNDTATGSLSDLASEKADILIPAGILTQNRYSVTRPSHIHHTVDFRWIGPKRREIYDWLKVLVPDKTNLTPVHGLTFVSFVIVAMLIRKLKPHLTSVKNYILFDSFVILLGQSAKFVTKSSLLNSLFLLWVWFCFINRIDHQGDLVESLQRVSLEPPFESVDEAVTKVDGYGGSEVFLDYFKDTPFERKYKVIPLFETNNYIQRIFEGERFLLASNMILIQKVRHGIQILEDRIITTGTCYYMRPGWPAAKHVDQIIVRLVETGFIENLLSQDNQEWKLKRNSEDVLTPKALSMSTLSTCFYGLIVMWVICLIVLGTEIIYYNQKRNEHRQIN